MTLLNGSMVEPSLNCWLLAFSVHYSSQEIRHIIYVGKFISFWIPMVIYHPFHRNYWSLNTPNYSWSVSNRLPISFQWLFSTLKSMVTCHILKSPNSYPMTCKTHCFIHLHTILRLLVALDRPLTGSLANPLPSNHKLQTHGPSNSSPGRDRAPRAPRSQVMYVDYFPLRVGGDTGRRGPAGLGRAAGITSVVIYIIWFGNPVEMVIFTIHFNGLSGDKPSISRD